MSATSSTSAWSSPSVTIGNCPPVILSATLVPNKRAYSVPMTNIIGRYRVPNLRRLDAALVKQFEGPLQGPRTLADLPRSDDH